MSIEFKKVVVVSKNHLDSVDRKDGFFMTDHQPLDAPDSIAGGSAQSFYSEIFKENRSTTRTVSRDLLFLGYCNLI